MRKDIQAIDFASPLGNLPSYIHWTQQIPLLTEDEEQALARRLYEENDVEAAKHLVLPHLRFVVSVARNYSGYGLSLGDLIQEGNIGLMKAVRRFDPNRGVRLVTFAVHWIKAEIHEFILKNWRIVKVATTKAQRKLFFNLRKMTKELSWFSNEETETIAQTLQVTPQEVRTMEARLHAHDESFDSPQEENDDDTFAPAAYLEDHRLNPEQSVTMQNTQDQQLEKLHAALSHLDERSRDILQARWLNENKTTLQELAAQYGVSAERIRQLESHAMQKIKTAVND